MRRHVAAALALCLALAACSSPAPSGPISSPSAPGTPAGTAPPATPAASPDEAPAGGDDPVERASSGRDRSPRTVPAPPSDRAALGALCRTYLGARTPRLVVEVDWQDGARNAPGSVSHLLGVLRSVVRTPGGVTRTGELTGPGDPERVWTVEDLRREADRVRAQRTSRAQAAMHVLFVRGRFTEENVIGVAHSASEIAIFPDAIGRLSALLGGQAAVQRSVLVHEAGHLLCLVNLTYRSHHQREDPEHPHHSTDRRSVMYWAIDTTAVGSLFTGPPPDDFTAQDRDDLRRLGAGDA